MRIKKLFAGALAGAMALSCLVMPAGASAGGSMTTGSFTGQAAVMGYNSEWGGWVAPVYGESGDTSGTLTTTVGDLMSAVNVTDNTLFGGFLFQVWNATEDDDIDYTVTVGGVEYESGKYADTFTTTGSGVQPSNTGAYSWGDCDLTDSDTVVEVTFTVNSYKATLLYEIDADIVEAYSSYDIAVTTSDDGSTTINGNTYYIDSGSGAYYVALDVTDVPPTVTVDATITFNE